MHYTLCVLCIMQCRICKSKSWYILRESWRQDAAYSNLFNRLLFPLLQNTKCQIPKTNLKTNWDVWIFFILQPTLSSRYIKEKLWHKIPFLPDPGLPGVWVWVKMSVCLYAPAPCWDFVDVTLADDDTNSIITKGAKIEQCGNW